MQPADGAVPPDPVDRVVAVVDGYVLLGNRYQLGRAVKVVAAPGGVDLAAQLQVDDQRLPAIEDQIPLMEVPMADAKSVDALDQFQDGGSHLLEFIWGRRTPPLLEWVALLQASFVVVHPHDLRSQAGVGQSGKQEVMPLSVEVASEWTATHRITVLMACDSYATAALRRYGRCHAQRCQ